MLHCLTCSCGRVADVLLVHFVDASKGSLHVRLARQTCLDKCHLHQSHHNEKTRNGEKRRESSFWVANVHLLGGTRQVVLSSKQPKRQEKHQVINPYQYWLRLQEDQRWNVMNQFLKNLEHQHHFMALQRSNDDVLGITKTLLPMQRNP